jgi:membrane protease YdiL (CAAX protease family)
MPPFSRRQILGLGILCEGGLGVVAWLSGWLLGEPCAATLEWSLGAIAWGVAASLPMLLAFLFCLYVPIGPLERIQRFSREIVAPLFRRCTVFDLALISTLAGVGEELLFRGLLQAVISRWWNPAAGLALSSLLFGLLHPFTVAYVVLAGLMGVYLGTVWQMSGNLLVVIVAHALYDFLILVYLVRSKPVDLVGEPVRD